LTLSLASQASQDQQRHLNRKATLLKSPLRYPGGKSRAVKLIKEFFPEDIDTLASPFFGGGSIELYFASNGVKVRGYDLLQPLCWFWTALFQDNKALALLADSFRESHSDFPIDKVGLTRERFNELKKELREQQSYSIHNAAAFYALNRSSFSGATLSGGYSKRAAWERFTDTSIARVLAAPALDVVVENKSFEQSIAENEGVFLYCDPPYLQERGNNLYGDGGDLHKSFDHEKLRDILVSRKDWILSYNDSPVVRNMYRGYEIVDPAWSYGMKNAHGRKFISNSSEILILGGRSEK
jgi:DNA adenine methylase